MRLTSAADPKAPAFAQASAGQLVRIKEALAGAGLPSTDLNAVHMANFIVAGEPSGAITHCAGFEVFGEAALVRSMLVTSALRGKGAGALLLAAIERHARARGVRDLYLLTTTAAAFFGARGYSVIERTAVPTALSQTTEFATLCPAAAVCMSKSLDADEEAATG